MPQDAFTKTIFAVISGLLIVGIGGVLQIYKEIKVVSSKLDSLDGYNRERMGEFEIRLKDQETRIRALEFKKFKSNP